MKTLSIVLLSTLILGPGPFVVSGPGSQSALVTRLAGCMPLTEGETDLLLGAGGQFVTDTTSGGQRDSLGIPVMHEDSVQVYDNAQACATADSAYRFWRITHGETDEEIPVALARLGSSGYYFGTSFLANHKNDREYIVFNSRLAVAAIVTYIYP